MTSLTEGHILKSLENVLDPATQKDLVTSGMVTGVVIKDGNVGFSIEVEPSRGAALEPMRKAAENAVASLKGGDKLDALDAQEAEGESQANCREAAHEATCCETSCCSALPSDLCATAAALMCPAAACIMPGAEPKGRFGKKVGSLARGANLNMDNLAVMPQKWSHNILD